jgi:hypothetical protein
MQSEDLSDCVLRPCCCPECDDLCPEVLAQVNAIGSKLTDDELDNFM